LWFNRSKIVAEALKKEEIEALLEAVEDGRIELAPGEGTQQDFVPYDFSKPHSLSRVFENNLATISDTFGKNGSITISNFYRSTVSMSPTGIRHVLFHEYIKAVEKPSCLVIINLPPLRGQAVLNIAPNIIFALVDKLLGGKGEPIDRPRDFTEIEFNITDRIVTKLLHDLKMSMSRFLDIEPSISRIENNPEFVNICPGMERVVSLDFELELNELKGDLSISIPIAAFEPVIERFDPIEEIPVRTPEEVLEDNRNLLEVVKEVKLGLRVVIGEKELPLSIANNLKEGDTIILDKRIVDPVDVLVEGITKFYGIPGRSNGRKAVKVVKIEKGE